MLLDIYGIVLFIILFIAFSFIAYYGSRFRKGNLNLLSEWGLAGRRLGPWLAWFLLGADVFTAYTFVAVPSLAYAKGSAAFFAVPYVAIVFAIALLTMPRLWSVARKRGYVTASDFVRDRFNSRLLSIVVAITGIVAILPYIALQIAGMQAVLTIILYGTANATMVSEIALVISFIVLAATTFTSGLRGVTLGSIFKDILIFLTVIVVIIVGVTAYGGFGSAFSNLAAAKGAAASLPYSTLPSSSIPGFFTLFVGSAFALYLYPHIINGSLSADSKKTLRRSLAALPIYSIGLAFLALFGILVYAVQPALAIVQSTGNGLLTVPALIVTLLPGWLAGICLLGVFVGGMVPAALMAIAGANLVSRNIVKEFKPKMKPINETRLAKWVSAALKFIALGFVFLAPLTYAIQLQLLGGIIILQILPAVFMGLFTRRLDWKGVLLGWIVGMASGIYLVILANPSGGLAISNTASPWGAIYIGLVSVTLNIIIAVIASFVASWTGTFRKGLIKESEFTAA
ncbi:MAG: sodium:solute symporter [Candidatus Marsarchaeota archaeon]|nr:sodium:solute symporter [Candidatus Marsarchaeota archaeon]